MLWLIWHMWILIALAFFGGVIAGWVIRARSDEAPERPLLETSATVAGPASEAATPAAQPEPEAGAEAEPEAQPEPEPEAETQSEEASEPELETASAEDGAEPQSADDLTAIKGLGPKAAEKLNAKGVTRFEQIAAWTQADIERFDALINGRGRIARDDWVEQAKALAKD